MTFSRKLWHQSVSPHWELVLPLLRGEGKEKGKKCLLTPNFGTNGALASPGGRPRGRPAPCGGRPSPFEGRFSASEKNKNFPLPPLLECPFFLQLPSLSRVSSGPGWSGGRQNGQSGAERTGRKKRRETSSPETRRFDYYAVIS